MSWLYTPIYLALLVVEPSSKRHGGELVAEVFKAHGVENIFTLPGGHVSPIVVASSKLNIRIIDVRHEATAVFSADASARLTGIPGVAVVTAGPGLTNTVTAIKNAQMAESPVVVVAGAAATMLKNRGSLQDIDQISLLKSATKKCFSVDCVRDITSTLREAFRVAQIGVPGPVLVELPVDTLYPYSIIAEQFAQMSNKNNEKENKKTSKSLFARFVETYAQYSINHIFADAWEQRDVDPLPVSIREPSQSQLTKAIQLLTSAKRPLIIMGSQAVLAPHGPECVAECIKRLKVPVYLNGAARGLLGSNFACQFRHARKEAIRESDCVLLLGAVCDFRLSYGRVFKRNTKIISVNRSMAGAKLNARIFWQPALAIESDVGLFVKNLVERLMSKKKVSTSVTSCDDVEEEAQMILDNVDQEWVQKLRLRDEEKDSSIERMAEQSVAVTNDHDDDNDESSKSVGSNMNPLKLLLELRKTFQGDDCIFVADGGDFVASASYILKPNGPRRWLDPGPFGTLGCGAGFALAAKLLNPQKQVIAVMGDGAFGYAIPELDTLVRHKIPVFWLIGNDACWTQIAREQVPMLGSAIGCELAHTHYHQVAAAFGAKGHKLELLRGGDEESSSGEKLVVETNGMRKEKVISETLEKAKSDLKSGETVVVNAIIGKTKFREGSISV